MQINTKFNNGDLVYIIGQFNYPSKTVFVSGRMTIGQVNVVVSECECEVTERYKCVETGLDDINPSYPALFVFSHKAEAEQTANHMNEMNKRDL